MEVDVIRDLYLGLTIQMHEPVGQVSRNAIGEVVGITGDARLLVKFDSKYVDPDVLMDGQTDYVEEIPSSTMMTYL